jgi:hypothetical protein
MKIKAGPLSRMKSLFTQELFPEKVKDIILKDTILKMAHKP